jgi:hypothetical protein
MNETPKQKLHFQPMNEGLGFHHFKDGLPYTAQPQKPSHQQQQFQIQTERRPQISMPQGTGATQAGKPRFSNQLAPSLTAAVAAPAKRPTTQTLNETHVFKSTERKFEFGYFYVLIRALAYSIDLTLNATLFLAVITTFFWLKQTPLSVTNDVSILIPLGVLFLISHWTFLLAQELFLGTSFGKRLFGLYLNGSGMSIFLRAVFFIPSTFLGGAGLLWSLIQSEHRCWHDEASDLQPTPLA